MVRYCITVIEYLLTTSMPAALVFAALWREHRGRKLLAIAAVGGAAAALALTVLRRTTAINRGMVNTGVLSLALVAALAFLACSWINEKTRGERSGVRTAALYSGAVLAGALLFYALPSLFLLPSDFVMAGQSVFSTEFLVNLTGALAGLLVVCLAGLMVFHAGTQILQAGGIWFMVLLSAALAANMINQAAAVTQFLMARRIIPLNRSLFRLIMPVLNNRRFFLFLAAGIAALPSLFLLAGAFSRRTCAENAVSNPAVKRKQRALARRSRRRNTAALVFIGLSVFALTGLKAWNERAVELSPAEPYTLAGEEIIIPIAQIEDGHLHRFAWNASDNTEVRFIAVKKSASAWGVGLDACDICGNTGYYERRDGIVCRLCDVVMNKSTIGFKGGCNPVPLAYTVREGAMAVRLRDLEQEKGRFK